MGPSSGPGSTLSRPRADHIAVSGPSSRPSKIVCIGRNYHAHAAELGNLVPDEPLIFLKPPSSVIDPGEPIVVPSGVGRVDYEGEIGILIGVPARFVPEEEAWGVVDGILPLNDVTARDLQQKDSQWSRAKGFDTFCPLGSVCPLGSDSPLGDSPLGDSPLGDSPLGSDSPLEPADFPELVLVTRVNGVERQRASASEMVFSVPKLISYISRIMTLEPGDVIATGTPEGIGALEPGDEVEVEIEGVGTLRNPVVGEEEGGA